MNSHKKYLNNNSKLKKLFTAIAIMLFLFLGIITGVIGISSIENYDSPYLAVFFFGLIGLLIGVVVAKKLKPIVAINKRMEDDYLTPTIFISIGFVGVFILSGSFLNEELSETGNCDYYIVTNKIREEGGFRRPELNKLYVSNEDEIQVVLSSRKYWNIIKLGDRINFCKQKSIFNFVTLPGDKWKKGNFEK